jgi:hypothetical protein
MIIAPCLGIFAAVGCCGCTFILLGVMLLVFWLDDDTDDDEVNKMFTNYIESRFPLFARKKTLLSCLFHASYSCFGSVRNQPGDVDFPLGSDHLPLQKMLRKRRL